jgi:alanine or glycine:cation symporter, AGCS family
MLAGLNKLLWGILSIFLVFMGLKYTFRYNFLQFRVKQIIRSLSKDKNTLKTLCLSLAGRIGVGSIAGVALAIYIGGPGTILWLWISAFIVAPLSFLEAYLAVKYKAKKDQEFLGGPSLYISQGLNKKKLSLIYSFLILLTYIGGFLTIQSNSISRLLSSLIHVNPLTIGVFLALITFIIILKGIKEISIITLFLMPIMTFSYVLLGIIVIIHNYEIIPQIIFNIVTEGLNFQSFFASLIPTIIIGIERGIFSSEAGMGVAAIAVGSSDSDDAFKQGYLQILGTYFISLLI